MQPSLPYRGKEPGSLTESNIGLGCNLERVPGMGQSTALRRGRAGHPRGMLTSPIAGGDVKDSKVRGLALGFGPPAHPNQPRLQESRNSGLRSWQGEDGKGGGNIRRVGLQTPRAKELNKYKNEKSSRSRDRTRPFASATLVRVSPEYPAIVQEVSSSNCWLGMSRPATELRESSSRPGW